MLLILNTNYTVTASATDVTGNTGTAQSNLLVDTVLPQVIINTFAGDNIVNNAEAGQIKPEWRRRGRPRAGRYGHY